MKQFFKMCNVFRRPEGLFLFGVLNTPYGGVAVPPASTLPLTASASEIGTRIQAILNNLPNGLTEVDLRAAIKRYDDHINEIGFRKSSTFEKKAVLVGVHYDGEAYQIVPYQKADRGGFVAMTPTKLSQPSTEDIGTRVLSAIEMANGLPPAKT